MSFTIDEMDVPAPTSASVEGDRIRVDLEDGRTILFPTAWYPRLAHATREELATVELGGIGLHWPDLNEDISIAGLLAGGPSGESVQSFRNWLERRRAGLPIGPTVLALPDDWDDVSEGEKGRPADATGFEPNPLRHIEEPVPQLTHAEVERVFTAGSPEEMQRAILSVGTNDPDFDWSQDWCVTLSRHDEEWVRGNALLALGHLARRFGKLNEHAIRRVSAGLEDASAVVHERANAAADDIDHYLAYSMPSLTPVAIGSATR